ncbi:MAG: N,N'-diacetyllegionaminate synthase [Rhodothermales bacterium]|jgi:N,N'-diacetyllegionaminate synthase
MNRTHIIAEAGTNHNARLDTGQALIDVAKASGADSVKFQIIYPEGLYIPRLSTSAGFEVNPALERRRQGMLSDAQYADLWTHAAELGLPISASVFDQRGIDLLVKLGVPYIKLASCDLNNDSLIRSATETGIQVILATGMSTLADVEHAVSVVDRASGALPVLLHCVSMYPTPPERANVGFVSTLKSTFGTPVGFSDHTETDTAAILAVALGATWFEKHFTLDRSSEGYDHGYAMEPAGLTAYIRSIREAQGALHTHGEKLSDDELRVAGVARRGLFAAVDLPAGHVLKQGDVVAVRPAGVLGPRDLPIVVGSTASRAIERHTPLSWDLLTMP